MMKYTFKTYCSVLISCLLVITASSVLADASSKRELRPFYNTDFVSAGLKVAVPGNPRWQIRTTDTDGAPLIELSTLENYYPPAVIQISEDLRYKVSEERLPELAMSALNEIRRQSNALHLETLDELSDYKAGAISGYQDRYQMITPDAVFEIKSIVGVFPTG